MKGSDQMAMCLLNSSLQFTFLHRTEDQLLSVLMVIFPKPPTSWLNRTTTSASSSKMRPMGLPSRHPPKMALQDCSMACSYSQKQSYTSQSMKPTASTISTSPGFTTPSSLLSSSAQTFRTMEGGEAQVAGVISVRGSSEQKLLWKHSMQVSCLFLMQPSMDLPSFLERLRKWAQFSRKAMKVTRCCLDNQLSIHPTIRKSECCDWFSSMRMNLDCSRSVLCSLHCAVRAYNIRILFLLQGQGMGIVVMPQISDGCMQWRGDLSYPSRVIYIIPNTDNHHEIPFSMTKQLFLPVCKGGVFWRKGGRFGSILYLTSTYSLQSTMNPSAQRKTQLKFRYQIQYTNEISDNDFFQLRSQGQGAAWPISRFGRNSQEEDGVGGEMWRGKAGRKKMGKEQPIILLQTLNAEENNTVKMEDSEHSFQKVVDPEEYLKTPLKHSTPKKARNSATPCIQTTVPRDRKGSEQEEVKGRGSRKGLAWISSHILDLLQGEYRSENRFTCGQISEKVLTDFYSSGGQREKWQEGGLQQKEKKTIRRRVYDSINVLIALGKIKKCQKYLFVESIDRRIGEEIVLAKRDKLAVCRQETLRKQAILERARNEYGKLMQLKARNEQLSESKQQGYSGTFSTFSPGHSIFRFPLLIAYGEPNSKMQVEADFNSNQEPESKDQIIISSQPNLYLLSDLSALQYLHFRPENRSKRDRSKREK